MNKMKTTLTLLIALLALTSPAKDDFDWTPYTVYVGSEVYIDRMFGEFGELIGFTKKWYPVKVTKVIECPQEPYDGVWRYKIFVENSREPFALEWLKRAPIEMNRKFYYAKNTLLQYQPKLVTEPSTVNESAENMFRRNRASESATVTITNAVRIAQSATENIEDGQVLYFNFAMSVDKIWIEDGAFKTNHTIVHTGLVPYSTNRFSIKAVGNVLWVTNKPTR